MDVFKKILGPITFLMVMTIPTWLIMVGNVSVNKILYTGTGWLVVIGQAILIGIWTLITRKKMEE